MKILMSLLQNRTKFLEEIQESVELREKSIALLLLAASCFFLYGFIIGSSHSFFQALSAAVKLPLLYVVTLFICFLTLFIFNSLFGSKRGPGQTLCLLLTATCVIAVILVAFAPVTLFFLITTKHYQFFKLLNVSFFSVSGIIGVRFLFQAYKQFPEGEESTQKSRLQFLKFWLLLYAFVGSQLGWTLRPFFGAPNLPFELIREVGGNFYLDILRSIGHVLGYA
jgi:flagellar biosynthesis protein FliQ